MKLRYQMRGLGVGIIVTALLMGVALDDGVPLSDAEIKLLASELGMVDGDSLKLSDVQGSSGAVTTPEPDNKTTEPTAESTKEPVLTEEPMSGEATEEPTAEPTPEPTLEPTPEPTAEPTPEPTAEPEEEAQTGESVTIVVKSGANSYSVSKQLAEAGLVENANDYDEYLCSNGYAERIQVGTFEIHTGSSNEEIAKIITKTK